MVEFLISIIHLVFVYSLIVIFSLIISLDFLKKPEKKDKENVFLIKKIGLVIIAVIIGISVTMIIVDTLTDASIKNQKDISNWITLTVEIGIGIAIGISILIYSQSKMPKIEGGEERKITKELTGEDYKYEQDV